MAMSRLKYQSSTEQRSGLPDPARTFEAQIRPVLHRVRIEIASVVEALTPPVRRVADLQAALGIDHHLSWSIFTAAHVADPLSIVTVLPGERAIGKFLDRAEQRGVSSTVIGGARTAFQAFQSLVCTHAGNREVFEAMVTGLMPEESERASEVDLKQKQAAFRANSLLWGRQQRQCIACHILYPSATPELLDSVEIRGTVGWHQTRVGPSVRLRTWTERVALPGEPAAPSQVEPLVPCPSIEGSAGILREFSSQPLPTFNTLIDEAKNTYLDCASPKLGITGEFTYYTGFVRRGLTAMPGTRPRSEFGYVYLCRDPVELYVCDMLVHQSCWGESLPSVGVYATPAGGNMTMMEFLDADRLPIHEKAVYLGLGLETARSPELPRHAELLTFAADKMGWNPREFRVFRLRVEYPPLGARIPMILGK